MYNDLFKDVTDEYEAELHKKDKIINDLRKRVTDDNKKISELQTESLKFISK